MTLFICETTDGRTVLVQSTTEKLERDKKDGWITHYEKWGGSIHDWRVRQGLEK